MPTPAPALPDTEAPARALLPWFRAGPLALLLALAPLAPVGGQDMPAEASSTEAPARAEPVTADAGERLPAAVTTRHELAFADRVLRFTATAGALTVTDARDRPEAEIGFVGYFLETDDPAARPITFAVNGGPGASSAYLHLGTLGPWRLPVEGEAIFPSQPVALVPNAETWLDLTDLVFIDPVGTGFSRLVEPDNRTRNRYLSIDGDIEVLAGFISRWLAENGRVKSPRYFLGESYGGFRGPLLAENLQTEHGMALNGMVLLSPVLDFGWWRQPGHSPLPRVSLLPSLVAAGLEKDGAFSPEAIEAAEDYAAGDYVADLLRGLRDEAAVARIVDRMAEMTGLEPELIERHAGRIDMEDFARELFRAEGRIASVYDAAITGEDPAPERVRARAADPVLHGMTAPLTGAMVSHYRDTLGWLPERRYILLSSSVNRGWDWGSGRLPPEAVGSLRRVLALDPEFRVLVVHGYTDLVTPYFASELILRQLPDFGPGERVRQETYRGGHMFYTRDDSRRAFRDAGAWLYDG